MATPEGLKKDFENLISSGKLIHSYIFFGGSQTNFEAGDSKLVFAKDLSRYLELDSWAEANNPLIDAMIIDTYADNGIDAVRRGIKFLWAKPIRSSRRTLIISGAGRLTAIAQQAILKIAEEPPPHALIILIMSDPTELTQSLASRFQKIFFSDTGIVNPKSHKVGKFAGDFLRAVGKERSDIIKEIINDDRELDRFVADIILLMYRNPKKNVNLLKELLSRLRLIKSFNTNKKLQLESALLDIKL
jgi:putative NADH-flavin reductase